MIKPIFLHLQSDQGMENRFDTIMMVNGTIAALSTRAQKMGLNPIAIDEAYPGPTYLRTAVRQEIEAALHRGGTPFVACTLLSYNAKGSLELLQELKEEYGNHIRTAVGGQLIRIAPQAYCGKWYIDHVATGDAEVCLEAMLAGRQLTEGEYYSAIAASLGGQHWDEFSYDGYDAGIEDRLSTMQQYRLGPFIGIRQLVVESVRECAHGYLRKRACEFCALKNIHFRPIFKPLTDCFRIERELVERYGINWVFDVSNQLIPNLEHLPKIEWLKWYIAQRELYGAPDLNRYAYLTTSSITPDTASLIREAGVRIAYVGIDGWGTDTYKAHGKGGNVEVMLQAAKDADLYLRSSVVIGGGSTSENLRQLPGFVKDVLSCCRKADGGNLLISFGCFMEIILPGSPVWYKFKETAENRELRDVLAFYRKMETEGYLDWEDECHLTELYFTHTQQASYEEALAARDEAKRIIDASETTVGVTIEEGGELSM